MGPVKRQHTSHHPTLTTSDLASQGWLTTGNSVIKESGMIAEDRRGSPAWPCPRLTQSFVRHHSAGLITENKVGNRGAATLRDHGISMITIVRADDKALDIPDHEAGMIAAVSWSGGGVDGAGR